MSELKTKYHLKRSQESGFTLIEIIVVLIVLSILAVLSVPKFIDLGKNAKIKAFEAAVSELNVRENLVWLDNKNSTIGWIDDATLFAKVDYDLGSGFSWKSSAEIDGGMLYFQNEEAKLDRSPSTAITPARWEMNSKKDKKDKKDKKK
jgi:prepilin-type N-terminal cleavage/methylation domain-containing protein